MFNVARFITPCIASLQAQTLSDFDVVIVNDGSTDNSADVARQRIAGDGRFTIIDQANSGPGPGGGRNGGLEHTRSNRLMFVDSDDALLPDALQQLVTAFELEPSLDVATTSAGRLLGTIVRPSHLHDVSHPQAQRITTAADSPWLMFDSTPWNKAFRREFFDVVVGQWPEQQLYEDIAPMTTSLLRAQAIAVLTERHYLWRVRGEGSITNAQTSIDGDLAQLDQLAIARHQVVKTASPQLLRWFDWKSITQDLLWMTKKLAVIPIAGREELHAAIRDALLEVDPALVNGTQPALRRCYTSILDRPHSHSTRQITQRRVALLQDRRTPDQALSSGFQLVTLRRQQRDEDGISLVVSSASMDLRGAMLRVSTSAPWAPEPRKILATVPAERSFRAMAKFRIGVSDVLLADVGRARAGSHYLEVIDRAGRSTEVTRSLADALKRRFIAPTDTVAGPLTAFIDDGRVRLQIGIPTPTIESASMRDGALLLYGTSQPTDRLADNFGVTLTSSLPGEYVDVSGTTTPHGQYCVEVPPSAVATLSTQPTWISLPEPDNPAIACPFGVSASIRVDRASAAALHVASGPFGEATLFVESNATSRARSLVAETKPFRPAGLGRPSPAS